MTVNIEICHRGANKHTMMMRFDHQPLQCTDKISNKINLCYYFKFSQEGFLFFIMIVFESFLDASLYCICSMVVLQNKSHISINYIVLLEESSVA